MSKYYKGYVLFNNWASFMEEVYPGGQNISNENTTVLPLAR